MLGLRNRDQLSGAVLDEFENLVAQLRGFLLVSFEEDGSLIPTSLNVNTVPAGAVLAWTTDVAPTGWLICDGSQVQRVDYKTLFDTIGTIYGPGDGVLTFNLPDLRGRFPLGKSTAGTGATLAATGGTIDHTHSGAAHTHTVAGHTHTISADGGHTHTASGTTSSDGSHTHTFSGTTGNNDNADVTHSGALLGVGLAGSPHTHAFSGTTDSNGTHSHSFGATTSSDGSHSHSGATGSTALTTDSGGTGTTGTANPPFQVFNYIIRT